MIGKSREKSDEEKSMKKRKPRLHNLYMRNGELRRYFLEFRTRSD